MSDELERQLRSKIDELRSALAYEAAVVEAQTLDLKALGKGRRLQLERCIDRMRRTVKGEYMYAGKSYLSLMHSLAEAEQWGEE